MDLEQSYMIELSTSPEPGDGEIEVKCRQCGWYEFVAASESERLSFADLEEVADRHFEAGHRP